MASKKKYSMYGASEFHEKRSKRSKGVDESKTAKNTTKQPTSAWYKDPAKSDILGIDSKKAKAKNVKQVINFLKSINATHITDKDIEYNSEKKAIVTYPKKSVNTIQKAINVRYNNVRVYKRNKQGRSKDFWISVLKK